MELRDLEYFSMIAEHGHLGRAAEALGLSQPALSMSLRRLEKSMQAKLVKRTPKGVELTTVGAALLSHVQRLRLSMHDVAREAADLSQGNAGDLRIGATPETAESLLPPAFSALFKVAPKVTVKVTVAAPGNVMLPALRSGDLDLLVSGIANAPFEDLVSVPLLDDEFVVVSSVNHRLARRDRVTIADLAQERWAMSAAGVPSWRWLHQMFKEHGVSPPRITMDANSTWLRLLTVSSSDLLGFTSRRLLGQIAAHFSLAVLGVREPTWVRHIGVSYRKDAYLPPGVLRLTEILKATAKQLTAELP